MIHYGFFQAEEAAMAKLVQERLDAERLPELLKEKQRKLKTEGLKKKYELCNRNYETVFTGIIHNIRKEQFRRVLTIQIL